MLVYLFYGLIIALIVSIIEFLGIELLPRTFCHIGIPIFQKRTTSTLPNLEGFSGKTIRTREGRILFFSEEHFFFIPGVRLSKPVRLITPLRFRIQAKPSSKDQIRITVKIPIGFPSLLLIWLTAWSIEVGLGRIPVMNDGNLGIAIYGWAIPLVILMVSWTYEKTRLKWAIQHWDAMTTPNGSSRTRS
ncbi:MAG: hypothetical protein LPK28_05185 [Bacteroidota bacterium]|nr:hypothetical protein [Bacteroidota bacterium]